MKFAGKKAWQGSGDQYFLERQQGKNKNMFSKQQIATLEWNWTQCDYEILALYVVYKPRVLVFMWMGFLIQPPHDNSTPLIYIFHANPM